jgi:serine/threonine-protein kinase HipA
MSRALSEIQVWLDADFVDGLICVGTLHHERGQLRFRYHKDWLMNPAAFALDPDLTLDKAPFFPNPDMGNFGVFLDSSPDRWGQVLMQRREGLERLETKDDRRKPRTLYAWDFLLGVQDETRQGALRFRKDADTDFLANEGLAAPPVASLRELEAIAGELSAKKIDDLDKLRKWLAVLVAPGASLGGARPKANFRDTDGSLWIAKFPARDDVRDIGAWEGLVHQMAAQAEIVVPPARTRSFGSVFHTFCAKRFDRDGVRRRFYCSAMTMLRKKDGENGSYLELAEFLQKNGAKGHIAQDLAQLFRRVVFNVLVGNRDDHLRNHGFILARGGWRLAPAFDMNPSIDKADHILALDDNDRRPDIDKVRSTAALYGLKPNAAKEIVDSVCHVVANWRTLAAERGIARADIELMAGAFSALDTNI